MEQINCNTEAKRWKQLCEYERYKIEAFAEQGLSPAQIGELIGKNKRTIERELAMGLVEQKRMNPSNSKKACESLYIIEWVYKADAAQRKRDENASRKGRGLKIGNDIKLADFIENQIIVEGWSPDVVLGRIKEQKMKFKTSICTKTLYNYIDKGIFKDVSNKNLWVKKDGKKRSYKKIRTVALNNKTGKSITERPKEADERTQMGHWEIDLVVGKQGTKPVILTLIERKTRKSLYVPVRNKTQKEVLLAIKRARRRLGGNFDDVFKSITADNGSEFLDSEGIKKAAKCGEVYYAHPYSSWERGSNENGNRMLRRFVPKGSDIGKLNIKQLQKIQDWVNNYPRKILGYKTANEMMSLE